MSIKQKINTLVSPFYSKVWHGPKGHVRERIKKVCDDMSRKQRLTVVTVLLSAFVLMAFIVFGHACYKIGAGHARQSIEIEHIRQLELPTENTPDVPSKMIEYEAPR